jgi:hypothetical protein
MLLLGSGLQYDSQERKKGLSRTGQGTGNNQMTIDLVDGLLESHRVTLLLSLLPHQVSQLCQ